MNRNDALEYCAEGLIKLFCAALIIGLLCCPLLGFGILQKGGV